MVEGEDRRDLRYVPDFGGFLVKANSEGQPGPQDYKRTHADGANMLADALAPHGGIVMWRAFVYSNEVPADRVKQAYDEFKPLDGQFRPNVLVQVKNGPLDFQPREPFHPLFGAMPKTPLMMEFQITKEYLGEDTHLVYLGRVVRGGAPRRHVRAGQGLDGRAGDRRLAAQVHATPASPASPTSGATATGRARSSIRRTGTRSAGSRGIPTLSSAAIADEWIRMTFSNDPSVGRDDPHMMLASREAVVNYMTPLGLAHIMATDHHYGPAPWVQPDASRLVARVLPPADSLGIGFDRTATGSNAVAQYAPPFAIVTRDRDDRARLAAALVPPRAAGRIRMRSGRTLWDELALHYHAGVDTVRAMQQRWRSRAAVRSTTARFARRAALPGDSGARGAVVARRGAAVLPDLLAAATTGGVRARRRIRSSYYMANPLSGRSRQASLRRDP